MKRNILVEPDVLEYIIKRGGLSYLPSFVEKYGSLGVVSISEIEPKVPGSSLPKENVETKPVEKSNMTKPESYEYDWDFKVLYTATDMQINGGGVEDFRQLFLDRYHRLSRIVRKNQEMRGVANISQLDKGEVKIIGMVDEVRVTSRGGLIFTLEDPTGRVDCYYPEGGFLLHDEVVGVVGTYNPDTNRIYVRDIVRPGVPIFKRERRIEENIGAVIISDTHVGSKMFLKKRWNKFIEWLKSGKNGAETVKYLLIGGDVVDGIGIYPNQEEELEITDIYAQYETFAQYLESLPDYIKVIIIPGNHDIVRNTEPQPALPTEIQKMFNGNVEFLPNPSLFILHGYRFLMYHGTSLNDLVELIPGMNYQRIGDIMKYMLEMRHLAPVYGSKVSFAPLPRDFMCMDVVPDVFITGHVHAFTYDKYKNVHIINASCWQAQTKYQKMMNFNPEPGKVALINFHTDQVKILSF